MKYEIKPIMSNLAKTNVPPPLFKGFLAGQAFQTKKGFRGNKIDSMWIRHLFFAFDTDDIELCAIAMESRLACMEDVVVGGQNMSPFQIGEFGFFSKSQFVFQAKTLMEVERRNVTDGKFVSLNQWHEVDERLEKWGNFSSAAFNHCSVGDSYVNLAIRKFAFTVAKYLLLNTKIDPLKLNADGHDAMDVLTTVYTELGQSLRKMEEDITRASQVVITTGETNEMKTLNDVLKYRLLCLLEFVDCFKVLLLDRQRVIDNDKRQNRFLQLRGQTIPPELTWNINQWDKAVSYVTKCEELLEIVRSKIEHHNEMSTNHVSLVTLVTARHKANGLRSVAEAALRAGGEAGPPTASISNSIAAVENPPGESIDEDLNLSKRARKIKQRQQERSSKLASAKLLRSASTLSDSLDELSQPSAPADHIDDSKLDAILNKSTGTSVAKKELYSRLGMKMETADDYSPIIGVLKQSALEIVMYR